MRTTANNFKQNLANAFTKVLPKSSDKGGMMMDMNKYSSEMKETEKLKGGKSDKKTLTDIAKKHVTKKGDYYVDVMEKELQLQLKKGMKVEREHTKDEDKAREIAMDHLWEDPKYYQKLNKIETKEQLIVRPIKKGDMEKLIGKNKLGAPVGKLFHMSKTDVKEDDEKTTAKREFAKDLQKDKDFEEFKKNAKYLKGGSTFSYGVPNVTSEDPYIKKKTKYGRPGRGKEENKEATGSGSSGAYSGPLFGGDDEFIKKSDSETPKLKEGLAVGAMGLDKVEAKEATTSGSVGSYSTPSMWAKSTKKKDWGPSRKTQIPGGGFVKVKKKCTRFPYCNQGDINALKITKNESVKEAIKNVSEKIGISQKTIINILEQEYSKTKKRPK